MTALHLLTPWLAALKPAARVLPSEWAEANLVLPKASNARPGRLRLTAAQRGMVDAAAEPGVREIVFMTSTQVGKSMAINSLLGWTAAGEAGPVLLVRPDDSDAKAYIRESLDPLIAASPSLRKIVGAGANGLDGIGFKSFPGGSLSIASSWKAAALAARAIRVLICDEVDRFANVVSGGEGEPVALAKRRLQTFAHASLTILASSPTMKATSRIAAHHARGEQRVLKIQCVECGDMDDVTPDRLAFEPGRPETARLLCLCCGHRATEAQRLAMVEDGKWFATTAGEPGVVSFQMGELASEFSSLETVAAQVDAAKTLEAKKVLTNTVFGLPFESEAEAEVDASDLERRAVAVASPYPAAIDFISAGVDVQADRLEITILATAPAEAIVLDHVVLYGDTSGTRVWTELDALLSRTFRTVDQRELPVSATFVDAGFQTQAVADFVVTQAPKGRKAWAIFGRQGFDRPALKAGARVRSLARSYILGVDNLKLGVVKALAGSDGIKPICLPSHLDSGYFAQLTAERLEVRHVRGYPRYGWIKERHTRNEALDCLVYAVAAATLIPGRVDMKPKPDGAKSIVDTLLRMNSHKENADGRN